MKKKIYELTNKQLYLAIYCDDDKYHLISYVDRECYPESENTPAKNIAYDNCRFCKKHNIWCDCDCKQKDIDFDDIRRSIYANDEVEINESNND